MDKDTVVEIAIVILGALVAVNFLLTFILDSKIASQQAEIDHLKANDEENQRFHDFASEQFNSITAVPVEASQFAIDNPVKTSIKNLTEAMGCKEIKNLPPETCNKQVKDEWGNVISTTLMSCIECVK